MRLAALYIHEHFLFDRPQTINFGARNHYGFSMQERKVLRVTIEENQSFVEGFFAQDISLMSALVGANGAGKTNILKIINAGFQEHTKSFFIYEHSDGSLYVENRLEEREEGGNSAAGKGIKIMFPEGIGYHAFDLQKTVRLYYSPVFDASIAAIGSPLSLNSNDPEKKLGNIFMDNIRKDAIFLHSEASRTIKGIYPDFPAYDSLYIVPKILYKSDFRKVYIDANIGNPQKSETLKNTIEADLRAERFINPKVQLKGYLDILTSSNMTDALKDIWDMPQYRNTTQDKDYLLHDSGDFLKNIEINIISFLVLNDVFPVTEFRGSYDFEKILLSTSFYEILDHFLAKYIVQFDRRFYERYKDRIRLDKADELIQIVMGSYTVEARTYGDLESDSMIQTLIHHNINGLKDIRNLHAILNSLSDYIVMDEDQSILRIDVENTDVEKLLDALFSAYSKVREYFSHIPMAVREIIDIDTNIHLSYGEKSMLNLYSTFYEFTQLNGDYEDAENFLLILDEADLGYHPIWKRKFIEALRTTMPELFSAARSGFRNSRKSRSGDTDNKKPKLQIIIATHDPLTLSDFPNSNVVYLRKNEHGGTEVLQKSEHSMKSFGANITDLLAHSFFVEDGLIGDFARGKIERTIKWLNDEKIKKESHGAQYEIDQEAYSHHERIIKMIDEPVIRIKLAEMLDSICDQKKVQRELIQREIDLLNEKLGNI